MKCLKWVPIELLLVLGLAVFAHAQTISSFKYVAINYPGAASTTVNGINNGNVIVGSYVSTSGHTHGFRYYNGSFKTIDYPNSTSSVVNGINDYGDMVGQYTVSGSQNQRGFLRMHTGSYSRITAPNELAVEPMGINKSLEIVGGYYSTATGQHGFIKKGTSFTTFDAPSNSGPDTTLNGVSNSGAMVGQVFSGDNWRGFYRFGTDLDFLQAFLAMDNEAYDVNGHGDVIACQGGFEGLLALHPEVTDTEGSESFPKTMVLKFPNATNTCTKGINYARSIVGTYQDSKFVNHGFLAIPQ